MVRYPPVTVPQGLHLFSNDACEQWPRACLWEEVFSQAAQPHINVIRVPVQGRYSVHEAPIADGRVQVGLRLQPG